MSDSKPYRSGPISYTPTAADIMQLRKQTSMPVTMCRDALAAEAGHQERAAEWLRAESANRWPDGGPRRRDIDWLQEKPSNVELVEADIPAIDDNLTFTAHRWLPREPIPYDEMRRLCGLPDVSAYIAKRDAELKVRKQYAAQSLIHMLTRATDQISVYRGPNKFPSYQDLRGPTQWIRHQVLLDALGTGEPFNEAAAVALRKDLTDEQRAVVLEQCAFIREHTEPVKPWLMWANPFLPPELNTFAKTKQERVRLPHQVRADIGGRTPQWMIGVGLVEPEPETPQQRALPRPSTTPPPWADNPAGQRRPTKTRNHRRVK